MANIVTLFLTYTIIGLILFVAWDIYRKRRIFKFASRLPGYRFYPIIGNGYHFIGKNIFTGIQELVKRHKLPCNLWSGHDYVYVTADPEEIKIILNHTNTMGKAYIYNMYDIALKDTLLLQPYETWKKNRKIFSKIFSQTNLNNQVGLIYKKSCRLVEELETSPKPLPLDTFLDLAINVVTGSFTGEDQLTPKDIHSLSHGCQKIQEIIGKRLLSLYFYPNFIFLRTPEGRYGLELLRKIEETVDKIIRTKRKHLDQVVNTEPNLDKEDTSLPLIDQAMRIGTPMTDEEIGRQLLLFILASIDTSSTTLYFTLTILGMYPEIQEKVYEEVMEAVGLTNPITHNDLPNLKYTEMVIYESMRLLPVIPLIGRYVSDDLDIGARVIPTGCNIFISIFNVHRNEEYWRNPLEYDPDRFLPDEVAKRHPYAFIPFSGGPKNCIGMKNGMMFLKTTLANIVRNHRIHSNYKSVNDIELGSALTLQPTHDLDCTFVPRLYD